MFYYSYRAHPQVFWNITFQKKPTFTFQQLCKASCDIKLTYFQKFGTVAVSKHLVEPANDEGGFVKYPFENLSCFLRPS